MVFVGNKGNSIRSIIFLKMWCWGSLLFSEVFTCIILIVCCQFYQVGNPLLVWALCNLSYNFVLVFLGRVWVAVMGDFEFSLRFSEVCCYLYDTDFMLSISLLYLIQVTDIPQGEQFGNIWPMLVNLLLLCALFKLQFCLGFHLANDISKDDQVGVGNPLIIYALSKFLNNFVFTWWVWMAGVSNFDLSLQFPDICYYLYNPDFVSSIILLYVNQVAATP